MYRLKGKAEQALIHSTVSPSELWHRRLAHIHYKALPIVSKVVTGLPEIKENQEGVCRGCTKGKNVKNPFTSSDNKAKGVLDIIHSDVCGPMAASSLSRYVYYVTFIDDYSRKTWIYLLKSKDFKVLIENHCEKKIKTLRSDNGGEFTSGEFNDLCKRSGIKRELSTP